jgi:RHS repeat-associated protein
VARHTYLPYGEEATATTQDGERLKFTAHERDLLGTVSSPADDLDYMHARHYSPITGRFLSTDRKRRYRPTRMPQRWNRLSYAASNPLKYVDPDGEDLKIAYDFANSGLTPKQQLQLQLAVRGVFKQAGVKNVHSYQVGGSIKPTETKPTDRLVYVKVTVKPFDSPTTFGETKATPGNRSEVSTAAAPVAEQAKLNFLTNITAHEIGHASGALPQYGAHSLGIGSILNPLSAQPEAGTIMEFDVPADVFGVEVREFSEEDAEKLRMQLNAPQPK